MYSMVVIADLRMTDGDDPLSDALSSASNVSVVLDSVVPFDDGILPYVWVEGNCDTFEGALAAREEVTAVDQKLDTGDRALYRLEWSREHHDVLRSIARTGCTVLAATGNGNGWRYRVRFPSRDGVTRYIERCDELEFDVEVLRIASLTDETVPGRLFELTEKQQEAVELAARRGYFDSPRRTSLSELASQLEISKQALSQRIRRAIHKIVTNGLLSYGRGHSNGDQTDTVR